MEGTLISRRPLKEKLNDKEYLESLSDRRRRELLFCSKILTEEELSYYSSIAVAYNVARRRYIEENIPEEEKAKYLYSRRPLRIIDK